MNGLDFGTAIGLIKGLGSPDPAVIESAVSDWLDDHPEATTTVQDGSITRAKLDSNLQETVDDVANLKSQMDYVETITGSERTFKPTKISALNLPTNGTQYVAGNTYETYYIPVRNGYSYVWTADKIVSANPALRLAFAESMPASGVSAIFIEEQHIYSIPIKFYFTAKKDGYLSVSVWYNQTSVDVMSVVETRTGDFDDLESAALEMIATDDTSIFIGSATRQIVLNEPSINARRIIYYVGDNTPSTWAGGLAIYKNYIFIGYDGGYIGAFNRTTGEFVALGRSSITNSHMNNLFFDYSSIVGDFPILYTSYCKAGYTYCHVYSIVINNGTIELTQVQRISYTGTYFSENDSVDWSYDADKKCIVAVIGDNTSNDKIIRFQKPELFAADVILTDNDIVSVVTTTALTTRQSNVIVGNVMLMLNGSSNGTLYAIDIDTGETVNSFALSPMSTNEPEGIAIYGGKVYINFHIGQNVVSANLFELTF